MPVQQYQCKAVVEVEDKLGHERATLVASGRTGTSTIFISNTGQSVIDFVNGKFYRVTIEPVTPPK